MPLRITQADETRAVVALRRITSTPEFAVIWAHWTPWQRLRFTIGVLLDIRGCCDDHAIVAARYLHRFMYADIDPRMEAVRLRALEIMAAVAIVDGHPGVPIRTRIQRTS